LVGFTSFWCKEIGAKAARKMLMKLTTGDRFHQHFTSSFCIRRSQKCKKKQIIWPSPCLFVLLGSPFVKAAHKYVVEIDPWCPFHQHYEQFLHQ